MKKAIKETMFFTNQNLEQGAEFLIEDGRFNDSDIFTIINTAGEKYMNSHGKVTAMNVLGGISRPKKITVKWLTEVFELITITCIDFRDPITGEFTAEGFINIF